jgi:hypothetical protein
MQQSTENPYITVASGLSLRFSSNVGWAVNVGDQPGAVVLNRLANCLHHKVSPRHSVQAIGNRDEIVTRITRKRIDANIVKTDVFNASLLRILRCTSERESSRYRTP